MYIFSGIISGLLSYNKATYDSVLNTYFDREATLSHPFLIVSGKDSIRKVFRVWVTFNKIQPQIQEQFFKYVHITVSI
jgi:hypothetical protein